MEEIENGCIALWDSDTDYLLTWAEVEQLPDLTEQDTQIYEYNQWTTPHCTLYSAFWAVSDLFNYQWTQVEINQMVDESYERGRIKGEWWYVKSAVDLVADYWNEHHSDLWKVVYYRVSLYDTELVDTILKKNYTLCSGYRWNSKYNSDYKEDWILNWVSFWASTYWHAVSWIGREWKRFIKDNYKWRKNWKLFTNIYEVEHTPSEMVSWWTYYDNAYLFAKVVDLQEIKRLNEFKTMLLNVIELNSELRHKTNDTNYQAILHYVNDKNRNKLRDIYEQLEKYI